MRGDGYGFKFVNVLTDCCWRFWGWRRCGQALSVRRTTGWFCFNRQSEPPAKNRLWPAAWLASSITKMLLPRRNFLTVRLTRTGSAKSSLRMERETPLSFLLPPTEPSLQRKSCLNAIACFSRSSELSTMRICAARRHGRWREATTKRTGRPFKRLAAMANFRQAGMETMR